MKQGWEIKRLGDVATYVNGYAFKPEHWVEKGTPIIRIQNLNNPDVSYNYCDFDIPSKYIVERGDILISWSASLGVYEWEHEKGYLNQHIFKVVFDKGNINKYYLKYAVSAKISDMLKNLHGATMKHIVKKDFDNTLIPVPPIAEQEKIVAELDCLSGIIEKKKQQLKELDNLAQSIFYEMFGDPVENDKGWKTINIENICSSIVRGPFGSALKKEFFVEQASTTYKVYEQKHAIQKSVDIGTYFIDTERFQTLKRFEVVPGDIIMSCSGTIGEFFVIPEGAERGIINQALLKYTLNDSIDQTYFLYVMEWVKENFDKKGTGLQNIGSVGTIKKTKISFPPLALQQDFASKIESIEKQKELIAQSIKETETLFNSRMDYYFN